MTKLFPSLACLAVITLVGSLSSVRAAQAFPAGLPATARPPDYQVVLGKRLNDKTVADFIAGNHCTPVAQYNLCPAVGLAFWANASQVIGIVYLSARPAYGFAAYPGQLPFGLTFRDTRAIVERKLGQLVNNNLLRQPALLPDEAGAQDQFHSWDIYKVFGVTLVYNSPSGNDQGATVYAVLVNAQP